MFNYDKQVIRKFLEWLDSNHNQTEVVLAKESIDDDGTGCLIYCTVEIGDVVDAYEDYLNRNR